MQKDPTVTKHSCRNCSGTNYTLFTDGLLMLTPLVYPLSGDISIFYCNECGFVGNESSANEDDYINYYTHFNKHHSRSGKLNSLDYIYFESKLNLIDQVCHLNWLDCSVLDYGSGALLFSELVKERGSRSSYNYDMKCPYPDIMYDLVFSSHCFEHIYNFKKAFVEIFSILKNDGFFCIAVPNLRGYEVLYDGPYNYFDLEHINHFDVVSLVSTLVNTGFEIVAVHESERQITSTLFTQKYWLLGKKQKKPS